ncbi:MAG: tRNA 4-thiouridine(8) synthase ThiI [Spirochaetaceae bacterium]|jgi:thiamine biosynthesis protein ThiI|nr:tRNA 4-thiouridine(8) synthase ThiI [Spirochaetaceae bacterium]
MTFLVKLGELTLKGGNKAGFEKILARNLSVALRGSGAQLVMRDGRFYISCTDSAACQVEDELSHLPGITGWASARKTEKSPDEVIAACVEEAQRCFENGARSFKVESRRTDKSFPLRSYELNCRAGDAISAALPAFKVDVRRPDIIINVEIREKAFIYGYEKKGLRGLPVGTAGRGLLLLSGGIDSPVAGFLMALRGMSLAAVYFHAYPYTSDEAKQKVVALTGILARYTASAAVKLFVVGITPLEQRIKERAPEAWATVLLRMAMMECASRIARRAKCKALITGESLSQVASQTVENIRCAESRAALPVFRPLIGMDKEDITKKAIAIGTYETSILPYEDCCTLFSPLHPILRAPLPEATALYESLDLQSLIESALGAFIPMQRALAVQTA